MECGGQSQPVSRNRSTLSNHMNNEDVVYTWDWGDARVGPFALPDGRATSVNRYKIDFQAWEQHNLDNDHRRSVRLVWATAENVDPKWTGQKPQ
jgi:hypothetical protein